MENLEKLKSWVDRKIPQRQEKLTDYVNFVQEKVGAFIVNFSDMDSYEVTNSYINFVNDLSNINKEQDKLFALVKLRDVIDDMESSEELRKELVRQRKLHFEAAKGSLALSDFGKNDVDIYKTDFEVGLRQMNYCVVHVKTLTTAIQILEGEIDI